jgi:hypothetical protein
MLRLLKDGGEIIFLEPNIYNPYIYLIFSYPRLRALAKLEPDEMAFSKRFIIATLTRAGFKDTRVDYRDFLLPGVPGFLITPSIVAGAVLEKIPLVNKIAQSIFIRHPLATPRCNPRRCHYSMVVSSYSWLDTASPGSREERYRSFSSTSG